MQIIKKPTFQIVFHQFLVHFLLRMKRPIGVKDQEYFRELDELCLATKRQKIMTFVILILLSITCGPSIVGFNFGTTFPTMLCEDSL